MTGYTVHRCPHCGGPLPAPSATRMERCKFCSLLLAPGPGGWRAAPAEARDEPLLEPHLPRLWVGGLRYAVLGRLAHGDASDVYRARRDARLTEHVLLKIARTEADHARLEREQETLAALESSRVQGAAHFTRLLPQRVDHGVARLGMNGRDGECRCTVLRWRSGFVHTFDDVFRAHSAGVTPESSVWMWKRVLELLGWVHRNDVVHGAVVPAHMLLHARDHGVVLAGWSSAARSGGSVTPQTDIAMSAQAILRALGGASAPAPLARLLEMHAHREAGCETDAWALKDRLDAVAREVFGPPRFVRFEMPGWS
ncbi:MAG: hypothetical protein KIT84_15735 [Labilithrix sp.]|nr:hypothetical protein [Labilithrix sp.]MCW5812478.1 hypothetical protein [Labilithrix sp.]